MPSIRAYLVSILGCLSALGQTATAVGTLQGSATDTLGHPIAGTTVRYQRVYQIVHGGLHGGQPVPAAGEAVTSGDVVADSNGAFSLESLPVGDYLLCATVPTAAYLDPCSWQGAVRATVTAASVTQVTLTLTKGVFLRVRVNDPTGLLPSVVDGPFGGGLAAGVKFGNGAYLGAANTDVDSGGRDYQMVIPVGTPLSLWLHSSKVALVNSQGHAVSTSGALVPFQAVAGLDQLFTFTVSGSAAQSQ